MAQLSSSDLVVATITLNKKGRPVLEEGKVDYPHQLHFFLTEGMVMEANSFIKKQWEKALVETKVPYTTLPHPPKPDQEF